MHGNPDVTFNQSEIDFWLLTGPNRIAVPSDVAEAEHQDIANGQLLVPSRNTDSVNKQKASNRRCQARYRQKNKVKWQELQDELAGAKAALKQMQSERALSSCADNPAHQDALSNASIVHVPWRAPDVLDRPVVERLLQYAWLSDATAASPMSIQQQYDMQQVADLSPQQVTLMRKMYMEGMTECLTSTGQYIDSRWGQTLQKLIDEFCCIAALKANLHHRAQQKTLSFADEPDAFDPFTTPASSVDWLPIVQNLQLSKSQKRDLLAVRRSYYTRLAIVRKRQQALRRRLHTATANLGLSDDCAPAQGIAQQLQQCCTEENDMFMQMHRDIGHGVLTMWQGAVSIVQAFPNLPDMLGLVNALAKAAGEPSVEAIWAAANLQSPITEDDASFQLDPSDVTLKAQQVAQSLKTNKITAQDIFG